MINWITNVLAWIVKNMAMLIGIVEAVFKLVVALLNIAPTKTKDKFLPIVDAIFSAIKKTLYGASDFLEKSGK